MLGLTIAGCAKDPTGDLSGSAASIATSFNLVKIRTGDSLLVTAEVRDGQDVGVAETPVPTTGNSGVATLTDAYLPPLWQARFYIKGIAAGTTQVTVSAPSDASVSTPIEVVVFD